MNEINGKYVGEELPRRIRPHSPSMAAGLVDLAARDAMYHAVIDPAKDTVPELPPTQATTGEAIE